MSARKYLVKLFAGWFIIGVLANLATMLLIIALGKFAELLSLGIYGYLSIISWAITIPAGIYAAIQIWRLKSSGRLVGIFLSVYMILYYLFTVTFVVPKQISIFNKISYILLSLVAIFCLYFTKNEFESNN